MVAFVAFVIDGRQAGILDRKFNDAIFGLNFFFVKNDQH
jgi:hypothetical protein